MRSMLGLARAAEGEGNASLAMETYAELRAIWHSADEGLSEWEEVRSGAQLIEASAPPGAR